MGDKNNNQSKMDRVEETTGERIVRELDDLFKQTKDMYDNFERYESKETYGEGVDKAFDLKKKLLEIDIRPGGSSAGNGRAIFHSRMKVSNEISNLLSKFARIMSKHMAEDLDIGR